LLDDTSTSAMLTTLGAAAGPSILPNASMLQ